MFRIAGDDTLGGMSPLIHLFIYVLAALGLRCWHGLPLVGDKQGLLLLQSMGLGAQGHQWLWHMGLVALTTRPQGSPEK